MTSRLYLEGKKFGRLNVVKFVGMSRGHDSEFLCKCDCGEIRIVRGYSLKIGNTTSCGCYQKEVCSATFKGHGLSKDPAYRIIMKMKERCENTNSTGFERYGGRGITICKEWSDHPETFVKWAYENGYSKELSVDRKDNNGNYEPGNCKWSTPTEQARNRRNNVFVKFDGREKVIAEWAEELWMSQDLLNRRYRTGDRGEYLFRPVDKNGDRKSLEYTKMKAIESNNGIEYIGTEQGTSWGALKHCVSAIGGRGQ